MAEKFMTDIGTIAVASELTDLELCENFGIIKRGFDKCPTDVMEHRLEVLDAERVKRGKRTWMGVK